MDAENNSEVAAVPDSPKPEESVMEKVAALKLETPEESTEPEKAPAAEVEAEQLAVNGHDAHVAGLPQEEGLTPPPSLAPTEPDESSEKVSEPAEAEIAEQQHEPESEPEPANAPEQEKLPETEFEPQATPEPMDTEPPIEQEKPSPVKPAMDAGGDVPEEEKPTENGVSSAEEVLSSQEGTISSEEPVENGVSTDHEAVSSNEMAIKAEPAEEPVSSEKPAEAETVAAEVDTEQVSTDIPKEEHPDPASGSLSFSLLEHDQTRDALRLSRTLVVLRGLPGSGKTFLARTIADSYTDFCTVICGDDHGIKPESPESCADGYRALDEAVAACCGEGTTSSVLIVVDDTNHTLDRLVRLTELTEQHHLVPMFLAPQTEWSMDPEQLSKRTKRGLDAAKLEAMKAPLLEVSIPLFFGWFLLSSAQNKVKCMSLDFVKTLDTLDAFKKHLIDFTGKAEAEVDLEHYFQAKGALHCTTKFCNYGKADGAKEYANNPAVNNYYGGVSELSLSALFVTPRTVGARVSLTDDQLTLWPADAEKEAESAVPAAASLPLGSRAHVTLGCAEGVEPVQTGLDLLDILALQQEGQQGETVEMELGRLTYYGAGRWLLALREPIVAPACFSSYYGRKETQAAKPEKKKKPKCSIL
ncbi:unnamed protein product [Ophioblennius macclurei]